ncbi:hypothetical protein [Prescottella equi]
MDPTTLKQAIGRAASSVVIQWPDVIDSDDLEQELWVWYLTSPKVREKLDSVPDRERHLLLVRQGHNIAAEAVKANHRFATTFAYSVDDVKAALRGEALSAALLDDFSEAMETLRERKDQNADVIRRRYGLGESLVSDSDRSALRRAHIALTDEMNRIVREKFDARSDGPGSKSVVSNATAQAATT